MKYTYKIKSHKEQIKILNEIFKADFSVPDMPKAINHSGEGVFAIPHYRLIGPTYNDALMKVFKALSDSRPCYDYQSGNWGPTYLHQLPVKETFWNSQKEEIILISAQFGAIHAGKSVKRVCTELKDNELPLGIYEVAIMLLTHPERLQDYNDLWIDCHGDEYSPDAGGAFSEAPVLYFDVGWVRFDAFDLSFAYGFFGSASAFVPHTLDTGILESSESLTLESAIKIVKENGYKIIKEF